ncbi:kanadaptin [Lycorma delicatula]|uniref:kanadaptin n=1 Tax=Lycorma delicatula TaxID=130591 RepID=UPI003F516F96
MDCNDDQSSQSSGNNEINEFKMPVLPCCGIMKKNKKVVPFLSKSVDQQPEDTSEPEDIANPPVERSELVVPPQYNIPTWSCVPEHPFTLTEVKNGVETRQIILSKSLHSLGRKDTNDIHLLHESVSRYHAVIQYGNPDSESSLGYYIYDLDAANGTFVNKKLIPHRTFIHLPDGFTFKLGASTRFFTIDAPSYLKEKFVLETEERVTITSNVTDKGIDWGFGDDASEKDDPFPSFNVFADTSDKREIPNPVTFLSNWFEEEEQNIKNFLTTERIDDKIMCTLRLPEERVGEKYSTNGAAKDKKEAMKLAAINACDYLIRNCFMNEPCDSKKRQKDWEENDFYDSDEDPFFDRTGELDKKRRKRMKELGKTEVVTHTYESLVKNYEKLCSERDVILTSLDHTKQKLAEVPKELKDADGTTVFFNDLNRKTLEEKLASDKHQLDAIEKQSVEVQKLMTLVKPAELPGAMPVRKKCASDIPTKVTTKALHFPQNAVSHVHSSALIPVELTDFKEIISKEENKELSGTTSKSEKAKKSYNFPVRPPPEWLEQAQKEMSQS